MIVASGDCHDVIGLCVFRSIGLVRRTRQQKTDRLPWSTCVPLLIILSLLGWGVISLPILVIFGKI
jgi:hypothetical protein